MKAVILGAQKVRPLRIARAHQLSSRAVRNSSSGVGIAFDGKDAAYSSTANDPASIFFSSSKPGVESFPSLRQPVKAFPLSPTKPVPHAIARPPYGETGIVPPSDLVYQIMLHDETTIPRMKHAARLARRVLDYACSLAKPGVLTDDIDTAVHQAIIDAGGYPSPLNYAGFPKSLCSSINEVICHGIPDTRPLQRGDIVSFDVSCFVGGVHGDNCATVIVGDEQEVDEIGVDWRGVPYKAHWDSPEEEAMMRSSRRLVHAAREALYAAIGAIGPGGCLTQVGAAVQDIADEYGYSTVGKYQGHGICEVFHCAPFVQHFRNKDYLELVPGMIFTIEPMLVEGSGDCFEWNDDWTVATSDDGMAAQFEHTILITEEGVEILTIPDDEVE